MTRLSQKCQYALRTVLELARRGDKGPVSVSSIAEAQAIPPRFLELIVKELRRAGIVESRRGAHGGYILAKTPQELSVGQIIQLIEGPTGPVDCTVCGGDRYCPLLDKCVLAGLWQRARSLVDDLYNSTSIQDLIEEEKAAAGDGWNNFSI